MKETFPLVPMRYAMMNLEYFLAGIALLFLYVGYSIHCVIKDE
jgi:hypothetical protein